MRKRELPPGTVHRLIAQSIAIKTRVTFQRFLVTYYIQTAQGRYEVELDLATLHVPKGEPITDNASASCTVSVDEMPRMVVEPSNLLPLMDVIADACEFNKLQTAFEAMELADTRKDIPTYRRGFWARSARAYLNNLWERL